LYATSQDRRDSPVPLRDEPAASDERINAPKSLMTNVLSGEASMNTISFRLTTLAVTFLMNGLIMGTLGYLFEIQSHPQLSVIAFAKEVVTHPRLI
jgi:hypothetical protein